MDGGEVPQQNTAGTRDVLAIRYGTRPALRSEVFLHHDLYDELDAEIGMDYFFWMIRDRTADTESIVLVDCGFNDESGGRRNRTMLIRPADALASLGVDPADVETVVVTHAHYDHIGNLDLFPRARMVLARSEFEFWTGPMARRALFAHSVEEDDLERLRQLQSDDRVELVDTTFQVADGVLVEVLGGHTPGQAVVTVTTDQAEVVLASDAVHYYDEVTMDRPFVHMAELPASYTAFDTLSRREAELGHVLVAGHDPQVMERFPALAPELPWAVRVGMNQELDRRRKDDVGGERQA